MARLAQTLKLRLEPFGDHVFTQPHEGYWLTFDWKAAALFWCSDLRAEVRTYRNIDCWTVMASSGRHIAHSSMSESVAWCRTFSVIFAHLQKERA